MTKSLHREGPETPTQSYKTSLITPCLPGSALEHGGEGAAAMGVRDDRQPKPAPCMYSAESCRAVGTVHADRARARYAPSSCPVGREGASGSLSRAVAPSPLVA